MAGVCYDLIKQVWEQKSVLSQISFMLQELEFTTAPLCKGQKIVTLEQQDAKKRNVL